MTAPLSPLQVKSHPNENRQISIFVLIDALGWTYLEGREFLSDALLYRKPLRTVFGFSSGAIPTILTGVYPSQTGHWNLFYYDPQTSPFRWLRHFRFLPEPLIDNRIGRKIAKELGRRVLGLGPLFECFVSPKLLHLFNWVEKRSIYQAGGISGARSIFDELTDSRIPFRVYSYHHWNDPQILTKAAEDLAKSDATFFFLYLSELDHFLHDHCTSRVRLEERIAWYGEKLRELLGRARAIDPHAVMTVFSDHGMTPVRHHHDLMKEVQGAGFTMPDDYLAVYDSTMARYWFFSDSARERIQERLRASPCGRIVPDEELRQLGTFFPDRRFGDTIFLLHPGWMLAKSDFNGPQWMPVGMHGYHPDDPYSDAVFLSSHQPPVDVRTIADVYQCMRKAMA